MRAIRFIALVSVAGVAAGYGVWLARRANPLPAVTAAPAAVKDSGVDQVRVRLTSALETTRQLESTGSHIPEAGRWRIHTGLEFDQAAIAEAQFPHKDEVAAYFLARPWSRFSDVRRLASVAPDEVFPTAADAAALRILLGDSDSAVRSLAAEALATLLDPQDVEPIAVLLKDNAPGAPLLVNCSPMQGAGEQAMDEDRKGKTDNLNLTHLWGQRQVSAYAQAALLSMTDKFFDRNLPNYAAFADWWKTHDQGKDSQWYWDARMLRIMTTPVRQILVGEGARYDQSERTALLLKLAEDLHARTPEVEAKIILLTGWAPWDSQTNTEASRAFSGIFPLRIGSQRTLELLEGKNVWADCDSADIPAMQQRMASMADKLFAKADFPRVRAILEKQAADKPWMPVMVSRLLPNAPLGIQNDPETRQGYLHRALGETKDPETRVQILLELVQADTPNGKNEKSP